MKGWPSYLSSRFDYEYIRSEFPDQWREAWQELLDAHLRWTPMGEADGEGVTNSTHRVVEITDADGIVMKIQEQLGDPNSKLKRLGFSVREVQEALNG